jgi:hypothetical protein
MGTHCIMKGTSTVGEEDDHNRPLQPTSCEERQQTNDEAALLYGTSPRPQRHAVGNNHHIR